MMMTTKNLFQYFLIGLILLWPVWAIGFVFLRWVFLKARSFLGSSEAETAATFQKKEQPSEPVDKLVGIS